MDKVHHSLLHKAGIPKTNFAEAKKRGFSIIDSHHLVIDGWYALSLRHHIGKTNPKEDGSPGNWYELCNIAGSSNLGTYSHKTGKFEWPNAPRDFQSIYWYKTGTITLFEILFATREDLLLFQLTYL